MSDKTSITESIRETSGQALSEGKVGVVIGYGKEAGSSFTVPIFVRKAEDAKSLIFDKDCLGNLAVYLPKKEIQNMGKIGLVVKGCDLKAVNVLLRENVVKREDLYIIGVSCDGVGEPQLKKCSICEWRNPEGCDIVVGESVEQPKIDSEQKYIDVAEIDKLSLEERWTFWKKQLDKCIRCYACRQICPLCYCKQCIVEKSIPQWVETSPHLRGNVAWNVARAFHLTGRCIGCGECERVCPVGISLGVINNKMSKLIEEWYDFRSGLDPSKDSPFSTWSEDDPEPGIL